MAVVVHQLNAVVKLVDPEGKNIPRVTVEEVKAKAKGRPKSKKESQPQPESPPAGNVALSDLIGGFGGAPVDPEKKKAAIAAGA